MKKRLIQFKPGTITLYDKEVDIEFGGSLFLKNQESPIAEKYEEEQANEDINKESFLKSVDSHLAKINDNNNQDAFNSTMVSLPEPASKNIFKRYLELLDFPLLFNFLKAKSKVLIEKLFYSENKYSMDTVGSVDGPELPVNRFLPKINPAVLSKVSFSVSVVSFILLLIYFSSTQLSLSANIEQSKPEKLVENQIGFEKPVKQFEPTPDPQPISREFRIKIEKIGLSSDVTPNVDLSDEAIYKQKLHEDGIAHALGSYFPGQDGPVYLFAHSTDTLANIPLFNAKFFALKDLEVGDVVEVSYHGNIYNYSISDKQIIKPVEINIIQNTFSKLVLQTCWPPGTDWQRLVIFADPI